MGGKKRVFKKMSEGVTPGSGCANIPNGMEGTSRRKRVKATEEKTSDAFSSQAEATEQLRRTQ